MKQSTKNLIFFLMMFLGLVISQSAMAVEYGKTITITTQDEISYEELISNASTVSPSKRINTRILVKNGKNFSIKLPNGSLTTCSGVGTITNNGESILFTEAGSLSFKYSLNGTNYHVHGNINYYGILQYDGNDAPKKIGVVKNDDSRIGLELNGISYISETEELYVPEGKFGAIWWSGNTIGNSPTIDLIEGQTCMKTSLANILDNAKKKIPNYAGEIVLDTEFDDGTPNVLSDGNYGGVSHDQVEIYDCRTSSYTISLTLSPAEGGTVQGAGSYEENKSVTVTATPNEGYQFVKWTENGTQVSTQASYSFTATKDRTLVANFKKKSYTITAAKSPSTGGSTTGSGTYEHGSTVTLTATANTGWDFVQWNEEGAKVSTESSYSFTATANRYLTAIFQKQNHTVTLNVSPAEGGTVQGAGSYEHGKAATITATPNEGWKFIRWTYDGQESYSNPLEITVEKDLSITAYFEKKSIYTITSSSSPIEGGTVTEGGQYEEDTQVMLIATANTGYSFVNWTENSVVVSTNSTYSFTATKNRNLVANFTKNTYSVTTIATPTEGGTVTGSGTYQYNEQVTVTATSHEGYTFVNWNENGTIVSHNNSYTFNVTGNHTLLASFEKQSYTVTLNASPAEGGTVQGAGSYEYGQTATITATPNDGFAFVNWTENGTQVSADASYSFTVTKDVNLIANFTKQSYILKVSADPAEGGEVTGAGGYEYNQTVTVTATRKTGWEFVNWTENNEEVSDRLSYSFQITKNTELVAHFKKSSYTVTFNVENGSGTLIATIDGQEITSGTAVEAGKKILFKATPSTNYELKEWIKNGSVIDGINSTTLEIDSLSMNLDIRVSFSITTSIGMIQEDERIISYANKQFNIQLEKPSLLQIFSTTGEKLIETQLSSGNSTVSLNALQSGVYIVKLNGKALKISIH